VPAEYKHEDWAYLGVNVDRDFAPIYVIPSDKRKQVTKLRAALDTWGEVTFEYASTDTLDVTAPRRAQSNEMYQYVKAIPNALFISAGRYARRFLPELEENWGADRVTCIDLKGFDQVEADEVLLRNGVGGVGRVADLHPVCEEPGLYVQ
jgi:hypothetical protein